MKDQNTLQINFSLPQEKNSIKIIKSQTSLYIKYVIKKKPFRLNIRKYKVNSEKKTKKKNSANKADKMPNNELIPLVEYGDLLTLNQVCEIYLISKHTLYKWVERKEIPYHRLGARKLVFHKRELSIWFAQSAECA